MCFETLALAALAAQGAGTYANYRANRAVDRKMEDNLAAEAERQRKLQAESDARLAAEAEKFRVPAQEAQQTAIAKSTAQALQGATVAAPSVLDTPIRSSAATEVKGGIAKKVADALAAGREEAERLATLTSFGRSSAENELSLGRAGEDIGRFAGFSQRSSGILPYEQQSAMRTKGRNFALGGDVANAVGQALALASMTQAPTAGAGATSTRAAGDAMHRVLPVTTRGIGDPGYLLGTPIADLLRRSPLPMFGR